jgi:starvation-inducible DNA-binding protein
LWLSSIILGITNLAKTTKLVTTVEQNTLELQQKLKQAFATEAAFLLLAQNFHWNVQGVLFPQFHEFFGHIYKEVLANFDAFAEQLRTLKIKVPATFLELEELSAIKFPSKDLTSVDQVEYLGTAVEQQLKLLTETYTLLEANKLFGLLDFISQRIQAYEKHRWQITSIFE